MDDVSLRQVVGRLVQHRFVLPVEKALHAEYHISTNVESLVPAPEPATDSIGRTESTWWVPTLNIPSKKIKVYECSEKIDSALCNELCLLQCRKRCCVTWTKYAKTSSVLSSNTACTDLHQHSLYGQTLKDLEASVLHMTNWDVHFIMCESITGGAKEALHINRLDNLVDSGNILLLNPNPANVSIVLQLKPLCTFQQCSTKPRKRGRKMNARSCGVCQMNITLEAGKMICLTEDTVRNWKMYSVSTGEFYILCIMGRFDLNNWFIDSFLKGKRLKAYVQA